jgi:hypothetical protein
LTDGEISNVTEVMDLCRSMSTSARIFSFGLGHSPSRALVKGLARATNGRFVFIPPKSSVDVYVGEQLQKALQPCIINAHVQWDLGFPMNTAPVQTPPIYANDRFLVYALANTSASAFKHQSQVTIQANDQCLGEAKIDRIPEVSQDMTIARLAAKALILELQHAKTATGSNTGSLQTRFQLPATAESSQTDKKKQVQQRIIDLSLKYTILSPHTAFVGVEKREGGSNAGMVLREVPIEISADDQHLISPTLTMMSANCMSPTNYSLPSRNSCRGGSRSRGRAQIRSRSPILKSRCSFRSVSHSCVLESMPKNMSRYQNELEMDDYAQPELSYRPQSRPIDRVQGWPTKDDEWVRHLISEQKFNGMWDLSDEAVQRLTGKARTHFSSTETSEIVTTALVIAVLEGRFASHSSLWYGVVQKARQQLLKAVDNDRTRVNTILNLLSQQLA